MSRRKSRAINHCDISYATYRLSKDGVSMKFPEYDTGPDKPDVRSGLEPLTSKRLCNVKTLYPEIFISMIEMPTSTPKCQIINAPSREPARGVKSIFLAGSTDKTDDDLDWREVLSESLADQPLTLYNPLQPDWDSTWREDISFKPYREQVEWELDMQEIADIVVVYFHPSTKAPISLLELGLCAKTGKAIVYCPEGYWKRGNVQIVCKRYDIELVEGLDGLKDAIMRKLAGSSSS
ncbi:hypothetical protein HD806DRAFT_521980 [Xylariaceae sp. AK1471]|nr:hypothetical protein HD806DRAFT_521980 [Xylariaceae sp. AK1471]